MTIDTAQQYQTIHHLDFSENFAPKFEPQSARFNKDQYTLHCTVAHSFDDDAFNKYIYNFSSDTSHDSQFSYAIVDHLMTNNDQCLIFHFKSDNCSQQHKFCFVFANWGALVKKYNKTIILYYGVSGHSRGLVDSMNSLRVKGPLQKSIITEKIFLNDIGQVKEHLEQKHLDKPNWVYKVVSEYHLADIGKQPMKEFKILQREKLHMIAFFPDGQIMGKENLCSCHECLNGNLNKCEFEPGRIINNGDTNSLRMIKLMAQSMRRMKFLKSHFSPISKKVCMLP